MSPARVLPFDNEIAIYNGVTGKIVKQSGYSLSINEGIIVHSSAKTLLTRGTTPLLHINGLARLFLGPNAGLRCTGTNCIGIGNSAMVGDAATATGPGNVAIGTFACQAFAGNSYNTAVGDNVLAKSTSGNYNSCLGAGALSRLTQGTHNTSIGYDNAENKHTGYYYTTTESYNITINNAGVAGDNNTIRIGNTTHTKTFLAGVRGAAVTAPQMVTVAADGQLGSMALPASGVYTARQSFPFTLGPSYVSWRSMYRIGDLITATFEPFVFDVATMSSSGVLTFDWGSLAAGLRPSAPTSFVIRMQSGGVSVAAYMIVDNFITITKMDGTAFLGMGGMPGTVMVSWVATK